jgi:hypothetical protein
MGTILEIFKDWIISVEKSSLVPVTSKPPKTQSEMVGQKKKIVLTAGVSTPL